MGSDIVDLPGEKHTPIKRFCRLSLHQNCKILHDFKQVQNFPCPWNKSQKMALLGLGLLKEISKTSNQGPVVQSIVNLTSLLRGKLIWCFTTL